MCMEQCGMCMSSECESDRSYDTKNILMHFTALKQSGRYVQVQERSLSLTSSFSADVRSAS